MFNLLDLTFVVIVILTAIVSFRRGLLLTLLSFVTGLASLALVYLFVPTAAEWLVDQGLFSATTQSIEKALASKLGAAGSGVSELLSGLGIPPSWHEAIAGTGKPAGVGAAAPLADSITRILASVVAVVAVFILLSLVVRLLLRPLARAANDVPVVGKVNRLGGLLFGIVWGLVLVYLAVVTLNAVVPVASSLKIQLEGSLIATELAKLDLFKFVADTFLS